jgi:hypothetical protein
VFGVQICAAVVVHGVVTSELGDVQVASEELTFTLKVYCVFADKPIKDLELAVVLEPASQFCPFASHFVAV